MNITSKLINLQSDFLFVYIIYEYIKYILNICIKIVLMKDLVDEDFYF